MGLIISPASRYNDRWYHILSSWKFHGTTTRISSSRIQTFLLIFPLILPIPVAPSKQRTRILSAHIQFTVLEHFPVFVSGAGLSWWFLHRGDPGFLSVCITSPVFTPVMLFSKCPTFCEKGTIVIPCPFHWPASNFRLKMVVRACRIPCIRKWNKKEQGRWWGRGAVAALPPPLHMWYANYHFSVGSATGELKQGVKPRKC
jgi:hypothetical protein